MSDYQHLTRDELIARLRTLEAERDTVYRRSRFREIPDTTADGIMAIVRDGIVQPINQAAEAGPRESEEQLRQFAEHAGQVLSIIDLALQTLRYVSPAYEAIWGRPRPCSGVGLEHFLAPVPREDRSTIREALAQAAEGQGSACEYRILRADGSVRWLRELDFPIRNESGRIYRIGGIAEDITVAKQSRDEKQALHSMLAQLERLSLANEMAAGVAHELNQPLAAAVTYSQLGQRMLSEGKADPEKLIDLLGKVSAQSIRAGQIIARLRQVVRKEKPHRTTVNINPLIREIGDLAENEIRRKRIHLRLELSEDPPPVLADPGQIQQVLLNLIWNAIAAMDYTPAGQRMLTLRTARIDQPFSGIEVTVTDTGPGLSAEAKTKLFQPFFTTRSGCIGLGLSLCRSIVSAHQGRLWATPDPERGVTFHFTLPHTEDG